MKSNPKVFWKNVYRNNVTGHAFCTWGEWESKEEADKMAVTDNNWTYVGAYKITLK